MSATIPPAFERQLPGIRLVVLAMALGALLLPAVVVTVLGAGESDQRMISYLALAMAVGGLAMGVVLPGQIVAGGRRRIAAGDYAPAGSRSDVSEAEAGGEAGLLLNLFRGTTIVGAALLEAPALFAAVAYMLEGVMWTLIPAFVFPVLIVVLHYPTRDRVETWLADQSRRLAEESRS